MIRLLLTFVLVLACDAIGDAQSSVYVASPPCHGQTCRIWSTYDPATISIIVANHWAVEPTSMLAGEGPLGYYYDWVVNETQGDSYSIQVGTTVLYGTIG